MYSPQESFLERDYTLAGRVRAFLFSFVVIFILWFVYKWYFLPASTLVNLPYCISEFFWGAQPVYNSTTERLSGVFISELRQPSDYGNYFDVLYFYEDGFVISDSVPVIGYFYNGTVPNWRRHSHWFDRLDPRNIDSYTISDGQIWFTTNDSHWETTWDGLYSDKVLVLDWVMSNPNSSAGQETFTYFGVGKCPFTR